MEQGLKTFPRPVANTGIINVKDFGVKGDGVANDATAINALISKVAAGTTLYFPSGTYRLASVITINKQLQITGAYPLFKPTTNTQVFIVTSTATKSKFSFLKFEGEGKNTASRGNQFGIYFNGVGYTQTIACEFINFPGAGIGWQTTNASTNIGGVIVGCTFKDNKTGLESLASGEYFSIIGCDVNSNDLGIKMVGGNNLIEGCNFNYCSTGLQITTGTNNAHGVINACNFNHCTVNGLDVANFTVGQTISNCHVYQSNITVGACTGLVFENCVLDATTYTYTNALNLVFKNCNFDTQYVTTVTSTTSEVAYVNCFHVDGRNAHDPKTFSKTYAKFFQSATVTTTDATQTTALSIPLVTNSAGQFEVSITAKNTSNNDVWVAKKLVAINMTAAASAAIVGSVLDLYVPISSAGLATSSATCDISSDSLRVRVTGVAATTIKWDVKVEPWVV